MIYCMEYLSKNTDWLKGKVMPLAESGYYLIFDCPGRAVCKLFGGA